MVSTLPPLKRNNFDFVVQYFNVEVTVFDESNHLGEDLIAETFIVADTAKPYRRPLPGIVVIDLGHGDIELVTNPAINGLQHLPFSLEVHVFRYTQDELAYTDIHNLKKVTSIPNLSPARMSVKQEPGCHCEPSRFAQDKLRVAIPMTYLIR